MQVPVIRLGPVSVHLGEKSGKYPDGNQVVVRGADTLVAFDTPLVANRLGDREGGCDGAYTFASSLRRSAW